MKLATFHAIAARHLALLNSDAKDVRHTGENFFSAVFRVLLDSDVQTYLAALPYPGDVQVPEGSTCLEARQAVALAALLVTDIEPETGIDPAPFGEADIAAMIEEDRPNLAKLVRELWQIMPQELRAKYNAQRISGPMNSEEE